MISTILYTSETGSCKRYAEDLSAALHIPAHPMGKGYVPAGTQIIYIGWLSNGKITGYKKAADKYDVAAVVQVGMSAPNAKSEATGRKKNGIGEGTALFTRQGAFNINKLPFVYKKVMELVNKKIAAGLEKKTDLSDGDKATLKMAQTGEGQPASWDVSDIVAWAKDKV